MSSFATELVGLMLEVTPLSGRRTSLGKHVGRCRAAFVSACDEGCERLSLVVEGPDGDLNEWEISSCEVRVVEMCQRCWTWTHWAGLETLVVGEPEVRVHRGKCPP